MVKNVCTVFNLAKPTSPPLQCFLCSQLWETRSAMPTWSLSPSAFGAHPLGIWLLLSLSSDTLSAALTERPGRGSPWTRFKRLWESKLRAMHVGVTRADWASPGKIMPQLEHNRNLKETDLQVQCRTPDRSMFWFWEPGWWLKMDMLHIPRLAGLISRGVYSAMRLGGEGVWNAASGHILWWHNAPASCTSLHIGGKPMCVETVTGKVAVWQRPTCRIGRTLEASCCSSGSTNGSLRYKLIQDSQSLLVLVPAAASLCPATPHVPVRSGNDSDEAPLLMLGCHSLRSWHNLCTILFVNKCLDHILVPWRSRDLPCSQPSLSLLLFAISRSLSAAHPECAGSRVEARVEISREACAPNCMD